MKAERRGALSRIIFRTFFLMTLITAQTTGSVGSATGARTNFSLKKGLSINNFKPQEDVPVIIEADKVTYDQEQESVEACGHVQLLQDKRWMTGDYLSYNKKESSLMARGNLCLQEIDGDLAFSPCMRFWNNFQEGILDNVRVLSSSRERITALKAERRKEEEYFDMASYTPCEHCKDELGESISPLWSIHARNIHRNGKENYTEYTDAHMEFFGVPCFYFPYFYYPNKRESGFLIPSIDRLAETGLYVATPFYWTIDSASTNKDILLTPYYMEQGGFMLESRYRHHFNFGKWTLHGSINPFHSKFYADSAKKMTTHGNETFRYTQKIPSTRGHIHSLMDFSLSPSWRLASSEWYVSDSYYLRSRPFFGNDTARFLESNSRLEGISERQFFQLRTIHYQAFQTYNQQKYAPIIGPSMHYVYLSPAFLGNTYLTVTGNFLSLLRQAGNREQRGIIDCELTHPITAPGGFQLTPFGRLRGDLFATHMVDIDPADPDLGIPFAMIQGQTFPRQRMEQIENARALAHAKNHHLGRFLPQAGLGIDWPLLIPEIPCIITPTFQALTSPCRTAHPKKIPNEDCQSTDFTDSELFLPNRMPGFDRFDDGTRMNYGLSIASRELLGEETSLFVGQSYSFTHPMESFRFLGIRKGFSDALLCVKQRFSPWVDLVYRIRADHKNLNPRYQEAWFAMGPKQFRLSGDFLFFHRASRINNLPSFKQLSLGVSSQFTRYWSIKLYAVCDMNDKYGPQKGRRYDFLKQGGTLSYRDECFTFEVSLRKSNYKAQEIKPGWDFGFSLVFKNLGGLQRNLSLDRAGGISGISNELEQAPEAQDVERADSASPFLNPLENPRGEFSTH